MPITRTTMIDDDGSGTTGTILNNAWLQTIYNQIDAADAGIKPTYGTWTPVDASGAGLTFVTGTVGSFAKFDRLVFVWAQVLYPVTGDASVALMSALPFIVRCPVGAWAGYGAARVFYMQTGQTTIAPLTGAGLNAVNADLSGANIIFSSVYLTD